MNMNFSTIILIFICVLFVGLTGCSNDNMINYEIAEKAKIGVIETTGYKNKSYIHFYDENLSFLYKKENNYASLSESWDDPICQKRILYSIPRGLFAKQDEKSIVAYSIDNDVSKEYDTGLPSMNELAVSKNYLFGVNTINTVSTISRNTIGETNYKPFTKQFPNEYIFELKVIEENLYCFSSSIENDTIHFKHISIDDLTVLEDYDITEYGSPAEMLKVGQYIYFTNQYTNNISAEPSTKITVFDTQQKHFSQIALQECSSDDILCYDNLLIISHYDRVQAIGNKITIYNIEDSTESVFEVKHDVVQCVLNEDSLYVLGKNAVTKYRIKDGNLIEVNTIQVDMKSGDTYFYLSSIFVCE